MTISVPSCRQATDPANDDSLAFERAINEAVRTGQQVYLPAGQGSSNGEYVIGTASATPGNPGATGNLRTNAYVFGDGIGQTIVRQRSNGNYVLAAYGTTTDTSGNVNNVTVRDLTLRGNVDKPAPAGGFNELEHLMLLAGVSDFRAERVEFLGFRGDAVFLGNSLQDTERHNIRLSFVNCTFDGINNQNRNGISIDDATDWTVDNCTFKFMTTGSDPQNRAMPGPIDIEPERNFNRVTRGKVLQCGFLNNGGFAFNVQLRPDISYYAQPISDFEVTGCAVQGSQGALRVIGVGVDPTSPDPAQKQLVYFHHNYVYETNFPLFLIGSYGVDFVSNIMVTCQTSILGENSLNRDIRINDNTWGDCATRDGGVIAQDGTVVNIQVIGNYWTNCGKYDGSLGVMYWLRGPSADTTHPSLTSLQLTDNTMECNLTPARITAVAQITGGRPGPLSHITVANNGYRNFTPMGPENLPNVP